MARKKTLRDIVGEQVITHGLSPILRELVSLLSNPNVPVSDDDTETATLLRDVIRDTVKHRAIRQQPIFNEGNHR